MYGSGHGTIGTCSVDFVLLLLLLFHLIKITIALLCILFSIQYKCQKSAESGWCGSYSPASEVS